LLNDPFGPVALARSITRAEDDDVGWCANLDNEHRLFLVAEVLLTVVHLQSRIAAKAKRTELQDINEIFGAAAEQLLQLVSGVATDPPLPANLQDYVTQIHTLTLHPDQGATELPDVG
jgi:hypothetical protein